jgi:hypothetical protein
MKELPSPRLFFRHWDCLMESIPSLLSNQQPAAARRSADPSFEDEGATILPPPHPPDYDEGNVSCNEHSSTLGDDESALSESNNPSFDDEGGATILPPPHPPDYDDDDASCDEHSSTLGDDNSEPSELSSHSLGSDISGCSMDDY